MSDVPRSGRPAATSADEMHRRGLQELDVYHRTGNVDALRRAIDLNRRVVDATADDNPDLHVHLRNLAHSELQLYEHTHDPATLRHAVGLYRRALDTAPEGHPYRETHLYGLGRALRQLYHRTGERRLLEEAADLLHRCVALPPLVPGERAAELGGLAEVLEELYGIGGDREHLLRAVAVQRQALARTPPGSPERVSRQNNLAACLSSWYGLTGERAALDEAVDCLRQARDETLRSKDPRSWRTAVNLAACLADRFRLDGRLAELDEAVALLRHVLETDRSLDGFHRLMVTMRAADLSLRRAELSGRARWADWAVQALQEAVRSTPYEDPNHGVALFKLGNAHAERYDLTDDPADLESAVTRLRAALDVFTSHDDSADNAAAAASKLAVQLSHRYDRTGSPADLDEAVELQWDVVRNASQDDPDYAALQGSFGQSLLQRFQARHDLGDLDRCTDHLHRALAALPPNSQDRAAVLNILSNAQLARHEHTGRLPHLHEAVETQRAAVAACAAGDPHRSLLLGGLAMLLRLRHDTVGGDAADVDEAVGLLRQVLALRPGNSAACRITRFQLAEALRSRADSQGHVADLVECVDLLRALVADHPADHPGQIPARTALAEALHKLSLARDDERLLAEAHEVVRGAVEVRTAPVEARLLARARLGQVCGVRHDWEAARHWLTEAVRLLPRLASRDLDRTDQQYVLARRHGLAAEAAAYALQAGRPEQALEVLEHGRGVLLGRLLQSRETDVARLQERAPALAERFVRLRDAGDPAAPGPADPYSDTREERAAERIRTREAEWDEVVEEIRSLPGMAGFLRPPSAEEIVRQAGPGPVVLVNISVRCDALIVADGSLDVVPLNTTADEVRRRVAEFLPAVNAPSAGAEGLDLRLARQDTVADTLEWLWDTVTGPVLERLALREPPGPGGTPPRVWWCPQGPSAFLPLHAAGYHGPRAVAGDRRCALSLVASSYTSTVSALHHARTRRAGASGGGSEHLVVSMARTPGAGDLPRADAEAHAVRLHLARLREPVALADEEATRDNVLGALRNARSAHFACHAVADTQDPSKCRILTHDHATRPLTVTDITGLRLDGAHLAYLSACATSSTRQELADEAVHITGAFQLAGFRHVVGTLWPVADELAPETATAFYSVLSALSGRSPADAGAPGADPGAEDDHVALALHATVADLHHRYAWFPSLWASHIHVGV
ncbi:CHAT domain-containing tetratricopeptide repeat protein [Streptomyces thermolineatus]